MPEPIIVASGSSIRAKMLRDSGVDFSVQVARIDEDSIKKSLIAEQANPRDIADTLAEMKARRVAVKHAGSYVIGSDQVLEINGGLMSKPTTTEEAKAQLHQLRGRQHSLYSAVVLMRNGAPIWRHTGRAKLWMRDFTDTYLQRYLETQGDDLLQTVGCYKLESEGVRLFSKIEGDYFTILGMPLIPLLTYLAEIGAIEK